MKRAYLLSLAALAVSLATPNVRAQVPKAPIVPELGDVLIGDLEHGAANNEFVFEDAIDLKALVIGSDRPGDPPVDPLNLQWTYYIAPDPDRGVIYSLNGATPLGVWDPLTSLAPPVALQIQNVGNTDGDPDNLEDNDPFTVTFRNIFLSPSGGINVDPAVTGLVAHHTKTLTLISSDGTTISTFVTVVYTSNDTSDTIGDAQPLKLLNDFDYTDPNTPIDRWVGGVLAGDGATTSGAPNGFCVGAPLLGNNLANWIYIGGREVAPNTGGMIKLVDGNVWQFRARIGASGTSIGTTPLLDVSFDNTVAEWLNGGPSEANYPAVTEGLTYAIEHLVLDNEGGANAIDQPQGRDQFQFWLAPAPMQLPQWRGLIDPMNSAFDASTDDSNDMSPNFRMIDFDGAGINAQADSGVLCLERVWISSAPLSELRVGQRSVINRPLVNANWRPFNNNQDGEPGVAVIDDANQLAFYKLLNGSGPQPLSRGVTKTFFPWVESEIPQNPDFFAGDLNLALYVIPWEADHLYLIEADIRSAFGGTPEAPDAGVVEGTAPVDVISICSIPPTTELISENFVLHGAAGTMKWAGSPRLTATLVNASLPPEQYYVGITHGQNGTNADIASPTITKNGNRFQPVLQFLNGNPAILGAGTDEFAVRGIEAYDLGRFPNP